MWNCVLERRLLALRVRMGPCQPSRNCIWGATTSAKTAALRLLRRVPEGAWQTLRVLISPGTTLAMLECRLLVLRVTSISPRTLEIHIPSGTPLLLVPEKDRSVETGSRYYIDFYSVAEQGRYRVRGAMTADPYDPSIVNNPSRPARERPGAGRWACRAQPSTGESSARQER